MCGIVGFFDICGETPIRADAIFQDAMIFNQLRGLDSSGLFIIEDDEVFPMKEVGSFARGLSRSNEYKLLGAVKDFSAIVGHCRAATRGAVTVGNAHPFTVGDITMVHNGTLTYGWNELLLEDDDVDIDVDSHAIAYALNKNGFEWTMNRLHGAYTLVWWDNKDKTLNFYRNSQRPLWFVETDDVMGFGSERMMIGAACERNHQKVKDMYELPVHTRVTVQFDVEGHTTMDVSSYVPVMVHPRPVIYVPQKKAIITTTVTKEPEKKTNVVVNTQHVTSWFNPKEYGPDEILTIQDVDASWPTLEELKGKSWFIYVNERNVRIKNYCIQYPQAIIKPHLGVGSHIFFSPISFNEEQERLDATPSYGTVAVKGILPGKGDQFSVYALMVKRDAERLLVNNEGFLVKAEVASTRYDSSKKESFVFCSNTIPGSISIFADPVGSGWFEKDSVITTEQLLKIGKAA